jgi:hypothetical protein
VRQLQGAMSELLNNVREPYKSSQPPHHTARGESRSMHVVSLECSESV